MLDGNIPGSPVLSIEQLNLYAMWAKQEQDAGGRGTLFGLSLATFQYFLGSEWVKRQLYTSGPLKPPSRHVDFENHWRIGQRGYYLAEMLFNLQHIVGFQDVLARLAAGDVEAVDAELQVGRLLRFKRESFRFVQTKGVLGLDYDIEIDRGGLSVCCEVKTKIAPGDVTFKGVYNSLEHARKQLPRDRPGLIVVRVPGSSESSDLLLHVDAFNEAAMKVLRQSSRLSGIVLITQKHWEIGSYKDSIQLSRAIPNPNARFPSASIEHFGALESGDVPWLFFNYFFNDYSSSTTASGEIPEAQQTFNFQVPWR